MSGACGYCAKRSTRRAIEQAAYAKRTEERALAATRKRHAFLLQAAADAETQANVGGTEFQNGGAFWVSEW